MENMKLTVEQIKDLMEAMSKTGLGELSVTDGEFKLKLSAKQEAAPVIYTGAPAPQAEPIPAEAQAVAVIGGAGTAKAEVSVPAETPVEGNVMKSPIVGTFYASPSPDKPPFVEVGQKVKKGDVLFIIESMKLMNEVQSEFDGEVAEILCENGQAVEFNQPVMVIQ